MKTDNDLNFEEPVTDADASGNELERGCSRSGGLGGISAGPGAKNAPEGRVSVPADLLDFVRSVPISEVMDRLGIGRGTVHRLRHGYWPPRNQKILKAWAVHQGRVGTASRWFLRRVYAGGVLKHGAHVYTSPGLAGRTDHLVAVAKTCTGGLVAQTLDVPLVRFALQRVEADHDR